MGVRRFRIVYISYYSILLFHLPSIAAIIQAGKAHGVQRADLYGCFYFYLSDQLRTFADRLRRFHINFRVFCMDPCDLSKYIREDKLSIRGLPAGSTFDRIYLSNIIDDVQHVTIPGILSAWGPLLKENKYATILGFSSYWHTSQENAHPLSKDETRLELFAKLVKDGRVCILTRSPMSPITPSPKVPRPTDPTSSADVNRVGR